MHDIEKSLRKLIESIIQELTDPTETTEQNVRPSIETVPIPKVRFPNRTLYPIDDLQPDESFFIAGDRASAKLSSVVGNYNSPDRKFTVRACTDNGITGARLFRTE
jgi:hypothetical protein